MQKKEYYKHNLPHFQQPGQAYFITWSLKGAVPKHKLKHLSKQLEILKSQLNMGLANSNSRLINRGSETAKPEGNEKLKKEYNLLRKRYLKAYNDLLDVERNPKIDLSKLENTRIVTNSLKFWENKKLRNHAFCIMPNHVHWVLELLEKDNEGNPVYLQDIMYSVKRFSANEINKLENKSGAMWQKESFDTTIRDEKHLCNVVEYTLNNPVNAGFIDDWRKWKGCWCLEQ